MSKNYKKLFANLCCSVCKNEFDENSIETIREENNLLTVHLVCKKCGKDFGTALLKLQASKIQEPLTIVDGPEPINTEDVINAHKFIKELGGDWDKYFK